MAQEFELLPHTADLRIRAYGFTFQELFRNTLKGMFSSIRPQGPEVPYKGSFPKVSHFTTEHQVHVYAQDKESLLIDFLSECVYLSDTHNEAYFDARFNLLDETELEGTIYGVKVTGFEETEIKAVTYHDLEMVELDGVWQATIVFDI
jgi:SHS2 domain-containing protein